MVLEVQEDKALMISVNALDSKAYHFQSTDITWENCSLRRWLNGFFLENAFSAKEKQAILMTFVDNGAAQGCDPSVSGGNNTRDKLFLLSHAEMVRCFRNDEARKSRATGYARARNVECDREGYARWWLRSPGYGLSFAEQVAPNGSEGYDYVSNEKGAVRPAFWLDLKSSVL